MDKYIKLKIVGQGAFGKALLVQDKVSHDKYVLKTVEIAQLSKKDKDAALKEVSVLSSLNHPNIIRYRESFTHKGQLCIVAEYADGGDLADKINKQGANHFSEETIIDWFVQICLALKHVHDRKILHRDLKTQNIFLTKAGMIKLGDFGIARVLDSTMEQAHTCIGTPYYLSPEICQEKAYDFKSDIWSLGCVLYELSTLKHAFNANNIGGLVLKILRGIYPPISNRYSVDLRNLVSAMLQRNPRKRPSIARILKMPVVKARIETLLSATVIQSEFNHTILHKGEYPTNDAGIPVIEGSAIEPSSTPSSSTPQRAAEREAQVSAAAAAERARIQAMERAADRAKRRQEAERAERERRDREQALLEKARARRKEEELQRAKARRESLLRQRKLRQKAREAEKQAREQAALQYKEQIAEITSSNIDPVGVAQRELQELTELAAENDAQLHMINSKLAAKKKKGGSKIKRRSSVSESGSSTPSARRSSVQAAREVKRNLQSEANRKASVVRSARDAKIEAHRAAEEAKKASGKAAFEARQRQKEEKKALEEKLKAERERKQAEWEEKRRAKLEAQERDKAEHRARLRKMKEGTSSVRAPAKDFLKDKKGKGSVGRRSSVEAPTESPTPVASLANPASVGRTSTYEDEAEARRIRREEERERMRKEIQARRKGKKLKRTSSDSAPSIPGSDDSQLHAQGGSAFVIDISDQGRKAAGAGGKKKKKSNSSSSSSVASASKPPRPKPTRVKAAEAFEVAFDNVSPDSPTFVVHRVGGDNGDNDDGDGDGDDHSEFSELTVSSIDSAELDAMDDDDDDDDDDDSDDDNTTGRGSRPGFDLDLPSTGELEEGIELPSHRTHAEEAALASQEYGMMMDDLRGVMGNEDVDITTADDDDDDGDDDDFTPTGDVRTTPLIKDTLKLNGKTLLMPDKNDPETAYYRIEGLKMYCEEELGQDEFIRAYSLLQIVRADDDDDGVMDELVEVLGTQAKAMKFLPILYQIIISEDSLRDSAAVKRSS